MLQKFIMSLFISLVCQRLLHAQDPKDTIPETKAEKAQEKKPYSITQFVHETYLFAKYPLGWDSKDWIKLGVAASATLALMPFDKRITNSTQGKQRYFYSVPIVGGRVYGEWYSIGGVAGAFGIYGLVANNDQSKKICIELLQAGIYSEAVTELLKVTIGRERPNGKNDFQFNPLSIRDANNSMPSGHTTAAVALSTVMSRHANSPALKVLAYVPAGFTMFSRIYQNKHWLSDEILGVAIGYFTGNWVVDLHEGKKHRINVTSVYPPAITVGL
jgi:membrane-associated phospholipid phosphatase